MTTTASWLLRAITTTASTWSTSWATAALTDGAHSLRAVVTDVAGNATTTASVAVTVQNNLAVTAPSTAVAGTPFTVTIRTATSVTGSQPITVTGLASSPTGAVPTVPTTATFTGGVATISVTATRSGAQTITVRTTVDSRQGTSGTVVLAPKALGQLYFTSCTGTTVSCPANYSAISGGFDIQGSVTASFRSNSSGDPAGSTAWTIRQSSGATLSGTVYVYCLANA